MRSACVIDGLSTDPLSNIISLSAPSFSFLERVQNTLSYAIAPSIYRYICAEQVDQFASVTTVSSRSLQKSYLDTLDSGLPDVLDAQGQSEFVAVNIQQIVDHVR